MPPRVELPRVEETFAAPVRLGEGSLVTPPRLGETSLVTPARSGGGSWSPRKRRSPAAAARSRRRLLAFHARLEPRLGPSQLQLLSRGASTPTSPRPVEHHLQGTNLQTEFERMGEEEKRWNTGASGHQGEQRGGVRGEQEEGGRKPEPGHHLNHLHHLSPLPQKMGGGESSNV